MTLVTSTGCYQFPFEDTFKILGCALLPEGKTHDAMEERMQSANKAFCKDILIFKSKDVLWKIKCVTQSTAVWRCLTCSERR